MTKLLPILVVTAVAVWSVGPAVKNLTGMSGIGYDSLLLVWIMNGSTKLTTEGNIFYPNRNTLAYSDLHTISGIIGQIGVWLTHNPTGVFGMNVVLGQGLTSVVVYAWLLKISKNKWGSVVGTTAFILSQIR